MRFEMQARYTFFILLVSLWLLANNCPALAARVTGEEGVTPVAPRSGQKVQLPAKPAGAKSPTERPDKIEPVRTGQEDNQKEEPSQTPTSAEEKKDGNRYVTIDFDNVDMAIFIKFISELTGKNFVIDKAVTGKVTVISPTKISVDEAYKVFESVLEVNDYALVPAGNITKIVPAATARSKNIETRLQKQAISPEDKMVTQLIPLKYADPVELQKIFTPFISKNSLMVPYAPTGTLIVTDVLSNIKRLVHIIEEIDVEGIGDQISVIPLEFATASELAKSLSTFFQQAGIPGGAKLPVGKTSVKIAADDRTNSLIILASVDDTRKVKDLIKLLDTEIPRGEGDIHVYYLQNADAEDMAAVLKAIPTEQKEGEKKGMTPAVVSKDVEIVADKATNSLVITANKADYLVLESVIKKLDIVRRMVYIEALIMEVSVTKNFDLGVEWAGGKDNVGDFSGRDIGAFAGSTSAASVLPLDPKTGLPAGLSLGVLGEAITIGGVTFPSLQAILHAYKGDSDVHILSTPQIMTIDNEEAEIIVATNIPYLTRQDTTSTGQAIAYSNYEYKDVGVTLNITPQINQERFVRLKLSQEVSQIVREQSTTGLPTTLRRQAKTTVMVQDGQTVVIGGLIDEKLDRSSSSVPCLGSIPGLGYLFKSFTDDTNKTNLYIFITPHIVENPDEARKVYEEKKDEIQGIEEGVIKMYKKPWSASPNKEVEEPK